MFLNKKLQMIHLAILVVLLVNASSAVVSSASTPSSCCDNDIIEITSQGSVSVQPDIATLSIGVSVTQKTSQAAVQQAASKISQVTKILKSNNVSADDIQTTYVSLSTKFNYTSGLPEAVGQTAQQTITVTVRKITKTGGNVGILIDKISAVDGCQLKNLAFYKADTFAEYEKARSIAFNNAKYQAASLASLSGRTLGKAIKISDSSSSSAESSRSSRSSYLAGPSVSTKISVGEISVSYDLYVKFQLV